MVAAEVLLAGDGFYCPCLRAICMHDASCWGTVLVHVSSTLTAVARTCCTLLGHRNRGGGVGLIFVREWEWRGERIWGA